MPEPTRLKLHRTAAMAAAQAPAPTLIETRGLRFDGGDRHLIDGVDLHVGQGRRIVVMGANGAGKSLLLRLLHGLLRPAAGEVLWKGRPLDRAGRRAQAMVFQRPVMLRRSVLGNLHFALAVRGIRGADRRERLHEALRRARLDDLANRPARVLSGGEQQRLAIVRALACEPEILFLDEPTASLDPASTHAIEDLIAEAQAAGVTIMLVTHDLGQARRVGEDVVFMHAGRVTETGPAARVLESPRSEAAQAWLEGRLYFGPEPRAGRVTGQRR